ALRAFGYRVVEGKPVAAASRSAPGFPGALRALGLMSRLRGSGLPRLRAAPRVSRGAGERWDDVAFWGERAAASSRRAPGFPGAASAGMMSRFEGSGLP